jgi:hypothetical protein
LIGGEMNLEKNHFVTKKPEVSLRAGFEDA